MIRSIITGTGSYLPARVMDNHEIATLVETNDVWIRERTGITQRHLAAEGEYTSHLAAKAAERALVAAGCTAQDVDLIIVATTTPDNTFPSTASKVQTLLGASHCAAFDIQAVCTGFVYALSTADMFLRSGQYKRAVVIGADTLSRIVDWQDRGTCILFGDGAGAVVLEASEQDDSRGILAHTLYADGSEREILYVDSGASHSDYVGKLRMQGQEVFKHAVVKLAEATEAALQQAGLQAEAVDWVIPHQANQRILDATIKRLKLPSEKLISTVALHANTSAASIPLALDTAVRDGRIQCGNLLALQAIGGGLTWGACVLRW